MIEMFSRSSMARMNGLTLIFILWFNISNSISADLRFSHLENQKQTIHGLITSITQDSTGFIWIVTKTQILRFDGYEFKNIERIYQFPKSFLTVKEISSFQVSQAGEYWIGTRQNGAFLVKKGGVKHYNTNANQNRFKIANDNVLGILSLRNGDTWLVTNKQLIEVKSENHDKLPNTFAYPFGTLKQVVNTSYINDFKILISNQSELLAFDLNSRKFNVIDYDDQDKQSLIWEIYTGQDDTLWLSTAKGLYFKKPGQKWQPFLHEKVKDIIKSIQLKDNSLWLGTAGNGLIKVNLADHTIIRYKHNKSDRNSLITDEVTRILVDNNNILWVTHFDGRVSFSDLNALKFGLNLGSAQKNCLTSKVIYDFSQNNRDIWMATQNEIVLFDEDLKNCRTFKLDIESEVMPIQVYEDLQTTWIASSYGIHKLNIENVKFEIKNFPFNHPLITFIEKYSSNKLLVGTIEGLFVFNKTTGRFVKLTPINKTCLDCRFMQATKTDDGYLLSTNQGLFRLVDGEVYQAENLQKLLPTKDILNTSFDQDNNLWVGTNKGGLHYIKSNKLIMSLNEKKGMPDKATIRSVIHTKLDELWVGTDSGLYQYESEKESFRQFQVGDGLQGNFFNNGTAIETKNGRIFFGGRFGYNAFFPDDIKINENPPPVILTELTRFNERLDVGKHNRSFQFDQDISLINKVVFNHKDYVIGFEFTALDYADPSRNQYAFMLEGFDPDWNYVDANNRTATYTNLPRGEYTFKVKAANKDGYWNEKGKSLKIKVLPAPWLSWWAICAYILTILTITYWMIRRKLQANQKLAQFLRAEVNEKTQEIQLQKKTVESLLVRKNELFANVSHEFRTPLTLILGHTNELHQSSQSASGRASLAVLERNANRLLLLVEQLLHLAKTSDFNADQFTEQQANTQIDAIVASFKNIAESKKIDLILDKNDVAIISATDQCLDATLGNLISNAIKYSPPGREVKITSVKSNDALTISVIDQGGGLTPNEQNDIFIRFKRLDAHHNITGVGIGLAVVKELLEINKGNIVLKSEVGVGSCFIMTLPTISVKTGTQDQKFKAGTLTKQLAQIELNEPITDIKNTTVSNKNIILVIEDNHDMRKHIVSALEPEFHCIEARNGRDGVAAAIEFIPDLIVCDVMMPEMDGFKVSRVVRSDQRTSHIPLVLLTALNDKENRVKGWRENIDIYLTKPFDKDELLLQIENIITIRNILKKKAHSTLEQNKPLTNSDLPQKDQDFVDKLKKVITNHYENPQLNRDKIASKMAVSERQLQRKLKALIDQNPMDMLREYRLKKAAEKIKEGYQIAVCSDEVGFKSPNHFSQCFKAHYGLTPKQYQQQFKKK